MHASANSFLLTRKLPAAVLVRVTHPNPYEVRAYDSYRAYCQILRMPPLAFDAWRSHSLRLFRNASSTAPRFGPGVEEDAIA
jgi:hypothetical protein